MSLSSNGVHMPTWSANTQRKSYARTPAILDLPRLTEVQLRSFEWFKDEGLRELFAEISPIVSFNKNLMSRTGHYLCCAFVGEGEVGQS
jgi:DNA-directed RNA polymerase subunit beta